MGQHTVETPRQERGTAGERADGDEEDSHVLDIGRHVGAQHREPNDADGREQRQPDAALPRAIRHERDQDGDQTGQHVRRHRVQLRLGGRPAQVGEQRRHEERDALHRDVDEEEAERADVVVDVEDSPLDVA